MYFWSELTSHICYFVNKLKPHQRSRGYQQSQKTRQTESTAAHPQPSWWQQPENRHCGALISRGLLPDLALWATTTQSDEVDLVRIIKKVDLRACGVINCVRPHPWTTLQVLTGGECPTAAAAASAAAVGTRPRLTRLLGTGGQGYNNHHNRCEDSTPSISIGHQHKAHSTAEHGNISKTKPIQKKTIAFNLLWW